MSPISNQIFQPSPVRATDITRPKPLLERLNIIPSVQKTSVSSSPHSIGTISIRSTPDTLVDPVERVWSLLEKLEDLLPTDIASEDTVLPQEEDSLATPRAATGLSSAQRSLNSDSNDNSCQDLVTGPPSKWPIPDRVASGLLDTIKGEDVIDWKEVFNSTVHLLQPKLNPTASAFVPQKSRQSSLAETRASGSRRSSINIDNDPESNLAPVDWSWGLNAEWSLSEASSSLDPRTDIPGIPEKDKSRRAFYLSTNDVNPNSHAVASTNRREIPLFPPGLRPPAVLRHAAWPAQNPNHFPPTHLVGSSEQLSPYLAVIENYMDPAHPLPLRSGVAQDVVNHSCQITSSRPGTRSLVDALVTASSRLSIRAKSVLGPSNDAAYLDEISSQRLAFVSRLSDGFGELASLVLAAVVRTLGDKAAVDFGWRLCDALVHEFHRRWGSGVDIVEEQDEETLLASLDLCRSIGALRKYGVLPPEHVRVCFEVLLDNLLTPAHVDALGFMIGGMGVNGFISREWDKLVERMPLPGCVDWGLLVGKYNDATAKMEWVLKWLSVQTERQVGLVVSSRVMEIHRMVFGFEQHLRSTLDAIAQHHCISDGL